jgi:hypothetical protein
MVRMGVGSEMSAAIAVSAMTFGMSAAQIEAVQASFLSESQGRPAQAVAFEIAHGMQHRRTSQGQHDQSFSEFGGPGSDFSVAGMGSDSEAFSKAGA